MSNGNLHPPCVPKWGGGFQRSASSGASHGGALYDDTKLAETRMVLQLIGSGPLLLIHPHFPLKDSKVTPGRGVGNVAARGRSSLQRVMDGHVHEKPFGAKKVQLSKKAGRKSIDVAPSVELKKGNDGYFVVDGKDFVIAPAEKTGRVMLMEDRAGTVVTTLQVLLSLSVPPVSIAVSCLSCLRRPPPPLAVHLLFVAPECTDVCRTCVAWGLAASGPWGVSLRPPPGEAPGAQRGAVGHTRLSHAALHRRPQALSTLYRHLQALSALYRRLQDLSAQYKHLQALSALYRRLQALSALYRVPVPVCASCFTRCLLCVPPVLLGASCVCLVFWQVPCVCASCFGRCLLCVPPVLPGASCLCLLFL